MQLNIDLISYLSLELDQTGKNKIHALIRFVDKNKTWSWEGFSSGPILQKKS